ncbi:chromate resistance protein ChrB domain-containing protein [Methylomagnum ishizawai]|uniref:chromate resistance protein ChrB domain-containing protein n=1 Tax=Methylomagnum ishizawai TaxID=1760988 RepID=UPI001C3293F8|nr:chromate resistance protein ChrB domain-containing protein [Methylomagnum ishizawai]BBL73043.1 chromate resistance exported protein [Methylomagnum ishizawai]
MNPSWLLLITSLPTQHAAGRMRVWRALKALGCGILRDGVYLLPNRPGFRDLLAAQAEEVKAGGGNAYLLALDPADGAGQDGFEALFDRTEDYAQLSGAIHHAMPVAEPGDLAGLRRQVQRLRKEFEALAAVDFFPGPARDQAAIRLEALELALDRRLHPDEPRGLPGQIQTLRREDYQGRTWATRRRPWIDRLASAWLIRRHIDPAARFLWLAEPGDCPADALGFDFDGAAFTHVGAKVSFEVLLASFGLDPDPALRHLAGLVHYLDVGGIPVPEAAGLSLLIRGLGRRWAGDDDALLAAAETLFDALYQAYSGTDP